MIVLDKWPPAADLAYWATRGLPVAVGLADAETTLAEHPCDAAWRTLAGRAGHGHDGLDVTR